MDIDEQQLTEILLLPLYTKTRIFIETSNYPYILQFLSQHYAKCNYKFVFVDVRNLSVLSQPAADVLYVLCDVDDMKEEDILSFSALLHKHAAFVAAFKLPVQQQFLEYFDVAIWFPRQLLPQPLSIYAKVNLRPLLVYKKTALEACYVDSKIRSQIQQSFMVLRQLQFKYKDYFIEGFALGNLEVAERVCKTLAMAKKQQFCLPDDAKAAITLTCLRNLNYRSLVGISVEEIITYVAAAINGVAGW